MDKIKHKISCRLSDEEKACIFQKAKILEMGFSEYIKYKLLKDEEVTQPRKLFAENQDLIIRLIISGYLKITAVANNLLSEEVLERIKDEDLKQQKKLGVEKKDHGRGSKINIK